MTIKDRQIKLFHELMYQVKVKDAMTSNVDIFSSHETFRTIQRQMKEKRYSGVPIVDNGQLVGLISVDDILTAFDHGHIDEPVYEYMTRTPATVPQNYSVIAASNIFKKHRYGRLPVVTEPDSLEVVGIITYSDILSYLLMRVNEIAEAFENQEMQRISTAQLGHDKLHFDLEHDNFDLAGLASTNVKKRLKSYGIDPKIVRRIAVICYEAEINVIIHSLGGFMELQVSPGQVKITVGDEGPGIPDVNQAMQPGYTTANEKIRALGFGAGLGLPNMQNYADEFSIESSMITGTEINATVYIPPVSPSVSSEQKSAV